MNIEQSAIKDKGPVIAYYSSSVRLCALCGFLFVFFAVVNSLYANSDDRVAAGGSAIIFGDKKDIARDKAVNDAFRRAIEQVVGVMVNTEIAVKNSDLLHDKIYSQHFRFIKNFAVTEERTEKDKLILKIVANININDLEKDLDEIGLHTRKYEKPKFLLLVSEQNVINDKPSAWWDSSSAAGRGIVEDILIRRLKEKGFTLVNHQSIITVIKSDPALSQYLDINLSGDTALTLASMGEADMIVMGQAVVKECPSIKDTTLHSCQANISFRIVNADNDETIASVYASAVAAHVDPFTGGSEALKKAAAEMTDKLVTHIPAKWQRRTGITNSIRLLISGLDPVNMPDFKRFLNENISGIVEIYDRNYRYGTAILDMSVTGSVKDSAEGLNNKTFNSGVVQVSSSIGNVISIKILKM
ncbi:MAG: hypothetical protein HY757_02070 [Nitrospirae bacterium]|nr:hypothetical protein [Nitrospirota bacterium]